MVDFTINGVELTFDLEKVTIEEYSNFANTPLTDTRHMIVLEKTTGQKVDFFKKLTQPDYRRVVRAFFKKGSEPLSDPT